MNLRRLDLNLLLIFDVMIRERSVTRAAAAVGLSQSAFSNALARLRERLGDELFIRTSEGMRPTAWALELSGPIRAALNEIEHALEGAQFDPATSKQVFRILALDYVTLTLMPALLARIQVEAPSVVVSVMSPDDCFGEVLSKQEADLALVVCPEPPRQFSREPIVEDNWVCVVREDHPAVKQPFTIESYSEAQHLLVNPGGGGPRGWADDALAGYGRTRHVAATIPVFGSAPSILLGSQLILTAPRRIGMLFAREHGLAVVDCPVSSPQTIHSLDMVWHTRLGEHPAQIWFRDLVRETAVQSLTDEAVTRMAS